MKRIFGRRRSRTSIWCRRLLILLVLMPLIGLIGGYAFLSGSLPGVSGTVHLAGLSAPVEIRRDKDGVPTIRAKNWQDGYFALGYVHAQDRLWQMEMNRRAGQGRLSEIVGQSMLKTDKFLRTLGIYRQAEASVAVLAPDAKAALNAYASGVNAWTAHHTGPLPFEFLLLRTKPAPWTAADSLVWGKLMALQLSGNYRHELLRARMTDRLGAKAVSDLFPAPAPNAPTTLSSPPQPDAAFIDKLMAALPAPLGPDRASNEWVLSGSKTASGAPILANDPHLQLDTPILWYLARIETPDGFVQGATIPGLPFHLLGQNQDIAWGLTTTGTDMQDLFVETLDPTNASAYRTVDGTLPFETRTETIAVKGQPDVTLTIRSTRHGPVISDLVGDPAGPVMALAFSGLRPDDRTAEAIFRINHASNWAGFTDALRLYQAPQQNLTYADRQGNIGFYAPGLVPIRKKGDGLLPVPGESGAYDWDRYIPFEELPHAYNPAAGQIVNANNAIVDDQYPYLINRNWDLPYRANRILDLLAATSQHTIESNQAVMTDIVSLPARDLVPLMLQVQGANDVETKALVLLRNWDGRMDRTRPEPALFNYWLLELNKTLYAQKLGDLLPDYLALHPNVVLRMLTTEQSWCVTIQGEDPAAACKRRLSESLTTALAHLKADTKKPIDKVQWGDVHIARLEHKVLSQIPGLKDLLSLAVPTDGGEFTVNRAGGDVTDPDHPFADTHGAGYRAIYDLKDPNQTRVMIATGQSGNPLSRHFGDFVGRWRDGKMRGFQTPMQDSLRLVPGE
jgi:penicillin G amidase